MSITEKSCNVQILIPRFRDLEKEMENRNRFYALTYINRQELRLARLNKVWQDARRNSKYYRELSRVLRLPEGFSSFEEFQAIVPRTPKKSVKLCPEAFCTDTRHRGQWMLTGGSTGSPTRVYWKLEGHLESLRDQYWARTWWGVAPFDRQAMLWGHSHSFGTGLRGYYYRVATPVIDRLRGRRRFSAYQMDPATLRKYYDSIARFRPRSLYAYSSAAHLLASTNQGRPPLSQPLAAAFLAAEPVQQSYRSSIADVFGCPAVGEYGSIECGMIAYEHPSGGYRVFERSVSVETAKNLSGYEVLVTQLRDSGFPLFRYEIGDETPAPLQMPEDGFETLGSIRGRSHDFVWTPSGSVFHAEMITHVMERIPEVVLFNVHQDQEKRLLFRVQTVDNQELSTTSKNWIKQSITRMLKEEMDITIYTVPSLERTASGKHRWITSSIQNIVRCESNIEM